MNTKTRFLVLDRTNTAQRPCDHDYHGTGQQGDKSPSFLTEAAAKAFANFLADANVGCNYYLAQVMGGVVQYTPPAAEGDWSVATPAGTE